MSITALRLATVTSSSALGCLRSARLTSLTRTMPRRHFFRENLLNYLNEQEGQLERENKTKEDVRDFAKSSRHISKDVLDEHRTRAWTKPTADSVDIIPGETELDLRRAISVAKRLIPPAIEGDIEGAIQQDDVVDAQRAVIYAIMTCERVRECVSPADWERIQLERANDMEYIKESFYDIQNSPVFNHSGKYL